MDASLYEKIYDVSAWILPLVIAITFHEAAHGFIAHLRGDDTAYNMGRVTFNPIKHVDPYGTIVIPGLLLIAGSPFLFGYAKPVPVNFAGLRNPRWDTILVAAAGPGTNLILAFISALLLHLDAWITPEQAPWLYMNLYRSVMINVVLAVFNMLPILPLDGGRVLGSLLPRPLARPFAKTERLGMILILILLILPSVSGIEITKYIIGMPADLLYNGIMHAAGIGNNS